ncbi:MAG: hypothetical protein JWR24_2899 [Actinoallomurus sp.]|nr:hypothetical protein [Actinoallomurus sp.]
MSDSTVSGSVRFSITDLLYYAPRFTELGIALSTAEVAAETRLDTLGEFWGHSSPDRAFAHGYPPSQYAALIIVKQLATELEGIGGGIELMAKNYGIAEDDINRQLGRINQAASDETRLLRGTGGLPGPPDIPPDQPPKSAPRTIPSPQPQPSPTPPGGSAPPTRQSSPVPNPNPGTPPDPDTWRRTSSTSLMGPWPSGDVNKMEEAAEA